MPALALDMLLSKWLKCFEVFLLAPSQFFPYLRLLLLSPNVRPLQLKCVHSSSILLFGVYVFVLLASLLEQFVSTN